MTVTQVMVNAVVKRAPFTGSPLLLKNHNTVVEALSNLLSQLPFLSLTDANKNTRLNNKRMGRSGMESQENLSNNVEISKQLLR